MRLFFNLLLIGFVVFCGVLVYESGLFSESGKQQPCILLQQRTENRGQRAEDRGQKTEDRGQRAEDRGQKTEDRGQRAEDRGQKTEDRGQRAEDRERSVSFGADNATPATVTLGSIDPASGFKFAIELTSKGAAVNKSTLSEFDDRDYKNPQPLVILSPVNNNILPMANKQFVFVDHRLQLPLGKLHWKSLGVEKGYDGSQTARFEAVLKEQTSGQAVIKLTKTYKVIPESYHIDCGINIENLSSDEQKVRFNLAGPAGIRREAARADMRKVVAGFRDAQGQNTSIRIDLRKFDGKKTFDEKPLEKNSGRFLWAAAVNKYFAAILVPLPDEGKQFTDWVAGKTGQFYNPDAKKSSDDENLAVTLKTAQFKLSASGQFDNTKTYNFLLYLGPKDKTLFDKTELYRNLGFVHTIDFLACCCPAAVINPLAFGILALMKWMYAFVGNYGIVIIILVFLVRLCMHPITKKSQVSMGRYTRVLNSPEAQRIKAKYKNRAEQHRHLMEHMKDQGVSPAAAVTGMIPMFVQMPIWIALYSAIYASIELRGAPFLPFWITDLSVPDALVRFTAIHLPIFGRIDSFNLLPILMGVAFYLQQKLMPHPSAATADPQVAQQQKMMMIMMPALFPLMLYKAPSGLNLYIMASVSAGAVEQYYIRKHISQKQQAESQGLVSVTSKTGGKVKKKKPKPFFRT